MLTVRERQERLLALGKLAAPLYLTLVVQPSEGVLGELVDPTCCIYNPHISDLGEINQTRA